MSDVVTTASDLWDRVIAMALQAKAEDWSRPTPCADWDVHDLLAHMNAAQTDLDGAPQPAPPDGWSPPEGAHPFERWTASGVAARKDWTADQLVEGLRIARDSHTARLAAVTDWDAKARGPVGETTEAGLLRVRCFDTWVHLWDLSTALGRPFDLDDQSPAAALAYQWIVELAPYLFGKRVGAEDGATLRIRLGAPLDRDAVLAVHDGKARWDADADPGEHVVAGKPAAFALLASGRGTPERWRRAGALDWSGANGEAFVSRARLFG